MPQNAFEEGCMSVLQDWIRREAKVLGPEFLQVDGFLKHRIAPRFIEQAGR